MTIAPETTIPLEPIFTLPSPTPSTSGSANNFHVVVGAPSTTQSARATSQMVVTESPTVLPLMPISLPMGAEDSLLFSFEAALAIRMGSRDGLSSRSTPASS